MIAYLGIGSNLGNRRKNIELAIEQLKKTNGIKISKISQLYETEPVGGPPQGKFLNGAIEIEISLSPQTLLRKLKKIEFNLGRKRTVKDGPRTIDLDILTYGDLRIEEEGLKIPHPKMQEREFVLKPLREIMSS